MDVQRLQAALTTPPDTDTPVVATPVMAEHDLLPELRTPAAACSAESTPTTVSAPGAESDHGMDDYRRLQRRLIVATACATVIAVPITAWFFDTAAALSLMVGGVAGMLYLRLLARSMSRLGVDRKSVGKAQLLVPVVLVLAAARIPSLHMLPALLGFLLYKPALIVQVLLDS
jgi:ATP synthase protein I